MTLKERLIAAGSWAEELEVVSDAIREAMKLWRSPGAYADGRYALGWLVGMVKSSKRYVEEVK